MGLGAKRACLVHPIYYLISVSHISVHNEPPRVSILNILAAGTPLQIMKTLKQIRQIVREQVDPLVVFFFVTASGNNGSRRTLLPVV